MTTQITCPRCKGTGSVTSEIFGTRRCTACHGKGSFPAVDVEGIVKAVFGRGGKFRKAAPKVDHYGTVEGARIYFVWRLARFHGGADVCMPMTAEMVTHNDPCKKELDALAEAVARKAFGTDMAAAYRWGQALGVVKEAPEGLPPSAYTSGPVADENKPAWESPELK